MIILNNVVNAGIDIAHVCLQGLQVFPVSPLDGVPPKDPVNEQPLSSRIVYQAVKTNVAFLDSVISIVKWSEKLSERSEFKFMTYTLAGIRTFHVLDALFRFFTKTNTDTEKRILLCDLASNSLDISIYLISLKIINLNKFGKYSSVIKLALALVEIGCRYGSVSAERNLQETWNQHTEKMRDLLRMGCYAIHFGITALFSYSLYYAGKTLVSTSFAFNERSVSNVSFYLYGILSASYGVFHFSKYYFKLEEKNAFAVGMFSAGAFSSFALFANKNTFQFSLRTIIGQFSPQLTVVVIATIIGVVAKLVIDVMSHLSYENDARRKIEKLTCSIVVTVLATSMIATKFKIVEHTSRLWLSMSQIALFAIGAFLIWNAWYVAINRLVIRVPRGENLEGRIPTLFDVVENFV